MEHADEDLTARLPGETLCNIIDFIPADERNFCAHVSRRWRSVAFDNHSACWFKSRCAKSIRIIQTDGPAAIALGLAQLKCRAVHPSTASVHIAFVHTPSPDADEALRVLPRALHRLNHLALTLEFARLDPAQVLDALAHPATQLRTLDLALGSSPEPVCLREDLFAGQCPDLTRLSLSSIGLPSEPLLQLRNLSHVRLEQRYLAYVLPHDQMHGWQPDVAQNISSKLFPEEVFVHAPNLKELVLAHWHSARTLSAPKQSTITGLASLEELRLNIDSLHTIIDLACLASVRDIIAHLKDYLDVRPTQLPDPRVPQAVDCFLSHLTGRLGVIFTGFVGSDLLSVSIVDRDNILRRHFQICYTSLPQVLPLFEPLLPRITILGVSTIIFAYVWPTFSELSSLEKFRLLIDRDLGAETVYLPLIQQPTACPALRTFHVVANRPWSSTMSGDELCGFARSLFTEETLSSAVLEVSDQISLHGWTAAHDAVFAPTISRSPDEQMAALLAQANTPSWANF